MPATALSSFRGQSLPTIGGLNIQGYDVRYIPAKENNPGATWTEEQDVWTLGSLEHTITGLTNGVRYDLELRALTSAGDGPWSSAFSATPKTTPDVPIISLITPDGSTLTVAWDAPGQHRRGPPLHPTTCAISKAAPSTRPMPTGPRWSRHGPLVR